MNQEQEARLYNKAFLHGKEVGLKFGREIALDEALKIIDRRILQAGNERESISKAARLSLLRWLKEQMEGLKNDE